MDALFFTAEGLRSALVWVLEASAAGALVVAAIVVVRLLLGRWLSPRWQSALWLVLILRLLLPWAPESPASIHNLAPAPWRVSTLVAHLAPAEAAPNGNAPGPPAPGFIPVDNREANGMIIKKPDPAAEHKVIEVEPDPRVDYKIHDIEPERTAPANPWTDAPPHEVIITTSAEEERAEASELRDASEQEAASTAVPQDDSAGPPFHWAHALALVWAAGAAALIARTAFASLRFRRALRGAGADSEATVLADECRAAMGVGRAVPVWRSDAVRTPALWGMWRPVVLLPREHGLDAEQLRHVLLHEFAHLKRRDIPLNHIVALLQALHWFNPIIWYGFRRMRDDRELACDAQVLSRLAPEEARDYGRTLVRAVEHLNSVRALPGAAGILEDATQLKRRITMITSFHKRATMSAAAALLVLLALGAGTLTTAALEEAPPEAAAPAEQASNPSEAAPAESRSLNTTQALKLLGVQIKQYTGENKGYFPALALQDTLSISTHDAGRFAHTMRRAEQAIGEDSWYLGYAVGDADEAREYVAAVKQAIESGAHMLAEDFMVRTPNIRLVRLREGVERFFITDINDPGSSARIQASLPVVIEKPGRGSPGGEVLFMNGRVERVPRGEFPMTDEFIAGLEEIDRMLQNRPDSIPGGQAPPGRQQALLQGMEELRQAQRQLEEQSRHLAEMERELRRRLENLPGGAHPAPDMGFFQQMPEPTAMDKNLEEPIEYIEFGGEEGVPVAEILDYVSELTGVNIIATPEIQRTETPYKVYQFAMSNVPLRSVLDALADAAGLQWTPKDDYIFVEPAGGPMHGMMGPRTGFGGGLGGMMRPGSPVAGGFGGGGGMRGMPGPEAEDGETPTPPPGAGYPGSFGNVQPGPDDALNAPDDDWTFYTPYNAGTEPSASEEDDESASAEDDSPQP